MNSPSIDLPKFPEGSDWTEPARQPYDVSVLARFDRSSGLVVLWSAVLVLVTITLGLLRADTIVYDGTNSDDVGAFDGMNAFLIVLVGVGFGMVPLVVATWQSVAVARRKPAATRRAAGLVAAYTAACGAVTTPVWMHLTAETDKDRRIEASAITDATHIFWAVGLLALVPLVVFVLSLRSARAWR